jgi:hypothetical protein
LPYRLSVVPRRTCAQHRSTEGVSRPYNRTRLCALTQPSSPEVEQLCHLECTSCAQSMCCSCRASDGVSDYKDQGSLWTSNLNGVYQFAK